MGRPRYQHPSVFKTKPKKGRAQWYVRVMIDPLIDRHIKGRSEKTLYLGFCDEMGKREAEKERDKRLSTEINNTPLMVQSQVKFCHLVDVYKTTYIPGLKPTTRTTYTHRLREGGQIMSAFGKYMLYEIDMVRVQRWIYDLQAAGLSRLYRRGLLSLLASVFDAAADWGYTQVRNPCKRVKIGDGLEIHDRRALTPKESLLLIQACTGPLKLIVETGLFTGMRISEILGLTWGAFNYSTGTALVKQSRSQQGDVSTPKTSAGRREIPLGTLIAKFVRPAGAKDADLVFTADTSHALQQRLRECAKKVGIAFLGFGFHTLRRTYATLRIEMAGSGPADHGMAAVMGHTSTAMTEHYVRRNDADVPNRLMELVNFSGLSRDEVKPN